ncbi:MAG TPA: single-stranded-DNA-specific exonuclease RecJ, partial [Flavisolibacter sp.]
DAFERVVKETIHEDCRTPEVMVDCELTFEEITPKFARILKQFEPFGPENMTPVFLTKDVCDTGFAKTIGEGDCHLKMFLKHGNNLGVPAIGFGLGKKLELVQDQRKFDAIYCIDENEWNGTISLQLRVKDIQ